MKNYFAAILLFTTSLVYAQRNKAPKMAPVYEKGYYVGVRGDTIRGEIQVNPDNETDFFHQFAFRPKAGIKPRVYNAQRSKAYGIGEKHFVMTVIDGDKVFLQKLVGGRLQLYEFRRPGKIDGNKAIVSDYYIKDTDVTAAEELKELKKLSTQFYKKNLRPYMKEQPMLWDDLDKYTFDERNLVQALREFNAFYGKVGT